MALPNADVTADSFKRANQLKARAAENTARAYGTSRLLEPEEITAAGLHSPTLPILAGRSPDGRLIRYGGDGHILTLAPSGAGKSTALAVPNLLSYPGSVVCLDPKGSLAAMTARQRLAMGQKVILLDPFKAVQGEALDKIRRSFNPLSTLDVDSPLLLDEIRLISSSLVIGEEGRNRYFSDSARVILELIILYVLAALDEDYWTLKTVVSYAYKSPERFKALVLDQCEDSGAFGGLLAQLANQVAGFQGEGGTSIWSSLLRSLNFLMSPLIAAALEPSDVDFRAIKERPTTVYLTLPATRLSTYGRFLRLMLSQILNSVYDSREPEHPVLFLLDEAASLDRLEIIEDGVALMRGFHLKLWLLFQDLSQLKSIYAQRWPTFVANSGLRQVFSVNDLDTADYVSRLMGNGTIEVLNESIQPLSAGAAGTVGVVSRPVLTPDEVARLPGDELLLLYDRMLPIRAKKMAYFDQRTDPEFAGLYDPDPYRSAKGR